jgi:hydrogenase-4 membrane subunit HyfE
MNKQELYDLVAQARKERERTSRIEDLIGNVLFSVLGACVLYTIALWVTR